jgi:hypothetical protein
MCRRDDLVSFVMGALSRFVPNRLHFGFELDELPLPLRKLLLAFGEEFVSALNVVFDLFATFCEVRRNGLARDGEQNAEQQGEVHGLPHELGCGRTTAAACGESRARDCEDAGDHNDNREDVLI